MPRVMHPDVHGAWDWEGNLQACIASWLRDDGWEGIQVKDAARQERGIDIQAHRDGQTLLVEVKGYPASVYASGPNAGRPKPTAPTVQARHWFSHALLAAMKSRDAHPDARIAIGLPDHPRYRALAESVQHSIRSLGIGILWVDAHCAVSWEPAAAARKENPAPDASIRAEVLSLGTSLDQEVTGRLGWRDGSVQVEGDVAPLLDPDFFVPQPGAPERRLRPTDGEAFIVAAAYAVQGTMRFVRLIDQEGNVLDEDELREATRRVGFET